jgi:hypothetical protein
MLDDASDDNTWKWMQEIKEKDNNCIIFRNETGDRVGHTILYDKGVELCSNEIFSIFHADMIATPNYVNNMIKHLEKGKVISSTRVEPPLHPPGPEKIIQNFGLGTDEFDDNKFQRFVEDKEDKTTQGIFAPWMMYKEDFEAIGGHDPLFAPMELEDSDIFNRFYLKGYELIQSRDSYCYHMTCRGSRFKDGLEIEKKIPLSDGTIWYKPKDSQEYLDLRANKFREWWRKWGTDVLHNDLMMPLVGKKFDIGFVVKNCNKQMLYHLEPWCSTIYVDCEIDSYLKKENPQTLYDLNERVFSIDSKKNNDIIIRFDGRDVSEEEFVYLTKLSTILGNAELEIGNFELGMFEVEVINIHTYEKDNINVTKNLKDYLEV